MNYRYIANITIEAKTALRFGSGTNSLLQDSPVQKDWNDLPMILGTSIVGMMRGLYKSEDKDNIFGYQKEQQDDGEGSRIIVSNALLLDADADNTDNNIQEELITCKGEFFKLYENLPIREHTAITDKGVAKKGSKFDEEIIYKGSRFKFRIEFLSESENEKDTKTFEKLLNMFNRDDVRLGSGSTKGYGRVGLAENEEIKYGCFNISDEEYKKLENSLNYDTKKLFTQCVKSENKIDEESIITYKMTLKPDDFFMFGSGFGNENNSADHTQVYEYEIDYDTKKLTAKKLLLPATSIKGAISHRTAFYYNRTIGIYVDDILKDKDDENEKKQIIERYIGENNDAVKALFGHKKESKGNSELGKKGRVDFEDIYIDSYSVKIFDHNKIDRFTGGTIDAALFAEETVSSKKYFEVVLKVKKSAFKDVVENSEIKVDGNEVKEAFEDALKDICKGMLPLGGMTTKGHGVFCGKLLRDDKCLIDMLKGGCDEK